MTHYDEFFILNDSIQVKAENTYLLALDGDIDFQAESITRLVDLMKKNKDLGAACGRIHPTGNNQKITEKQIYKTLKGCFS